MSDPLVYHYRFRFPNGVRRDFTVRLDGTTLELIQPPRPNPPAWTKLTHLQCPNCPLKEAQSPQCPAAASLVEVVEVFGPAQSIDQVDVRVETAERAYVKTCSLQEAVGSLIGLHMATSGCPVMARLRPMARHHLPFATLHETHYRALSMYLLAQYFRSQRGEAPDWALHQLARLYEDVSTVNAHFFKRLAQMDLEDASLNAIVRLDATAGALTFSIDQRMLEEIEQLFAAYVPPPPPHA